MKTGDTVTDRHGRNYQVATLLGRGLWGKSYVARRDDGLDVVVKAPLGVADLPAERPDRDRLVQACREILLEQAQFLEREAYPFLPRLEATGSTDEDEPLLMLHRYRSTFDHKVRGSAPLSESLDVVLQVLAHCRSLEDGPRFHGALHPENILLSERGEVFLSDIVTPTYRHWLPRLLAVSGHDPHRLPPEIRDATGEPPFAVVADTFAVGLLLWRAAIGEDAKAAPSDGFDKAALVELKDRIRARLKEEPSNPRFHTRMADRYAAVVNRAVSRQTTPSPPYRFNRLDEMLRRVEELQALVRPRVASVGRLVLPDRAPGENAFSSEEDVRFSATVGCSSGVDSHEEIGVGIAFLDCDSGDRLRDVPCRYDVDRHPSGRYRFAFRAEALPPGQYTVRLAFAVRDSGHDPETAEGEILVRAAPGYVPPREMPPPAAIPFDGGEGESPGLVEVDSVDADPDTHPGRPSAAPPTPRAVTDYTGPVPSIAPYDPGHPPPKSEAVAIPSTTGGAAPMAVSAEPILESAPVESPVVIPTPAVAVLEEAAPAAQTWVDLAPLEVDPAAKGLIETTDGVGISRKTPLQDWIASIQADPYMLWMGIAGVVIVLLLIALTILNG